MLANSEFNIVLVCWNYNLNFGANKQTHTGSNHSFVSLHLPSEYDINRDPPLLHVLCANAFVYVDARAMCVHMHSQCHIYVNNTFILTVHNNDWLIIPISNYHSITATHAHTQM